MIIFIGLAGSGKSTQANLLAEKLDCPKLSVGDLLRSNLKGAEAQQLLSGELIDDGKLLQLLETEIKRLSGAEFILDGSPRTMRQAKWLVEKVREHQLNLRAVVHLNASRQTVKPRLLARGRPDDTEAAIVERFAEYRNSIVPILDYLENEGFKVFEINAELTEQDVAQQINRALEEK